MPQVEYGDGSLVEMLQSIGFSEDDIADVLRTYPPDRIQRHAAYCIYATAFLQQVKNPPAWFKASIKGDCKAPPGFDAQPPQVFHFRFSADA